MVSERTKQARLKKLLKQSQEFVRDAIKRGDRHAYLYHNRISVILGGEWIADEKDENITNMARRTMLVKAQEYAKAFLELGDIRRSEAQSNIALNFLADRETDLELAAVRYADARRRSDPQPHDQETAAKIRAQFDEEVSK